MTNVFDRTESAVGAGPSASRAPSLIGRRVALRAVMPADLEFLHTVELSSDLGWRWRHRGATPGPDTFAASVWGGVLAQFLVIEKATNERIGLVSAYDAHLQDGHAHLAVCAFPGRIGTGDVLEGATLFIHYVFSTWPFRKLYLEAAAFNLESYQSGVGKLFCTEGRLADDIFAMGRYWDRLILAMTRSVYDEEVRPWAELLAR